MPTLAGKRRRRHEAGRNIEGLPRSNFLRFDIELYCLTEEQIEELF